MTDNNANTQNAGSKKRRFSCLKCLVWLLLASLALVILIASIGGAAAYLLYDYTVRPGSPGQPVQLSIPEGSTGQSIGELLASAGLIEHPWLFRLAVRLDNRGLNPKHGEYSIPKGLSPLEILEILHKGPDPTQRADQVPDELKVFVPEGETIAQMALRFDNPETFTKTASDPGLLQRMTLNTPSLEGFLMPNTYFFAQKPSEREVIERMLNQFEQEYASLLAQIPNQSGLDRLGVVTVASIVEEEARDPAERPLVAAVIYNRINKRIPLCMDSTLQYALGKYGQRMLDADKEIDSPYNTYKHAGLPPGPISNPGVASLRAALSPSNEPYLYFVSNADGVTHTFSKTLNEHNQAVARYRREIANQRRELRKKQNDSSASP